MTLNRDDKSQGAAGISEARRAALKRFGRFAAAAPAAMILLEPHLGEAAQHGRARAKAARAATRKAKRALKIAGPPPTTPAAVTPAPRSGGYH